MNSKGIEPRGYCKLGSAFCDMCWRPPTDEEREMFRASATFADPHADEDVSFWHWYLTESGLFGSASWRAVAESLSMDGL